MKYYGGTHSRITSKYSRKLSQTIVSRGDWLGNPASFKGTFCCFGFDVETYHHVTMTLHSLFQSKMADGADFLNGDDLKAIFWVMCGVRRTSDVTYL